MSTVSLSLQEIYHFSKKTLFGKSPLLDACAREYRPTYTRSYSRFQENRFSCFRILENLWDESTCLPLPLAKLWIWDIARNILKNMKKYIETKKFQKISKSLKTFEKYFSSSRTCLNMIFHDFALIFMIFMILGDFLRWNTKHLIFVISENRVSVAEHNSSLSRLNLLGRA